MLTWKYATSTSTRHFLKTQIQKIQLSFSLYPHLIRFQLSLLKPRFKMMIHHLSLSLFHLHEGHFKPNQICLIIGNLVTSNASIPETVAPLQAAQLRIMDTVILTYWEQGGRDQLLGLRSQKLQKFLRAQKMLARMISDLESLINEFMSFFTTDLNLDA